MKTMKSLKRFVMTVVCAVILIKFLPVIARVLGVIFVGTRGLALLLVLGILAVAGTLWNRRSRVTPLLLTLLFVSCSSAVRPEKDSATSGGLTGDATPSKTSLLQGSAEPIQVFRSESVTAELERFTRTRPGKKWARDCLLRIKTFQPRIAAELEQRNLPFDLLVIPCLESGYRDVRHSDGQAAGIWGFIAGTARIYGLRVDTKVDERRSPERLTEAAARHFEGLKKKLGDWPRAILAFNLGERRVPRKAEDDSDEDGWKLKPSRASAKYLATAGAMMILFRNPALID